MRNWMDKSDVRSPKSEGRPKTEIRNPSRASFRKLRGKASATSLLNLFGLRTSDFGLRIFTLSLLTTFPLPLLASSPWDSYNSGVNAYASQHYAEAEQVWQDLARTDLPRSLRQPVWFQIGNAEFRLGEPLEASAPEQAVELWRRSCAGYRAVLALNAGHTDARHNLALVERRLATLAQKLGNQLRSQAERKSLDEAINQLRPAADYLREAEQLAPEDVAIRRDRAATEQRLQSRLAERAQQAEKRGDDSAKQKNTWADEQAEKSYREALTDLDEAQRQATAAADRKPEVKDPSAAATARDLAAAQDRVQQKLADLLTRMGQREQKTATDEASYNPDEAMTHFDAALEKFQEAQAVQPEHAAAQAGEKQVRAAMEQLHMREGREDQASGQQAAPTRPAQAARELTSALSHFEAALALNPQNAEAESRAAEVRKQLPDLLTRAGEAEQRAGEKAEPRSTNEAMERYEDAHSAFQGALDLAPAHEPARQGLEQVEARLAKLRQQQADEAAKAAAKQRGKPQDLQQLLGQVKESQRNANREAERQRQAARNQPTPRKVYPDW